MPDLDLAIDTGDGLARATTRVLRIGFTDRVRRAVHWDVGSVLPWEGGTSAHTFEATPLGPMRLRAVVAPERAPWFGC